MQKETEKAIDCDYTRFGNSSKEVTIEFIAFLKAYVSQKILNWHSLRHSHSAEF
jgi:hypothetical protein